MRTCPTCHRPKLKPSAALPYEMVVRIDRRTIARLLAQGERNGTSAEWEARRLIWQGLNAQELTPWL